MITFKEFTAQCEAKVVDTFARGDRIDSWHLLAMDRSGHLKLSELPLQELGKEMFRLFAVPLVRTILEATGATMFGVVCEAWVMTQKELPADPKERARELKRLNRDGIGKNPLRSECINLTTMAADGSSAMRSWKIEYDDMRKPRLGDVFWDVEASAGDKSSGVESWWTRVFERSTGAAH